MLAGYVTNRFPFHSGLENLVGLKLSPINNSLLSPVCSAFIDLIILSRGSPTHVSYHANLFILLCTLF